MAVKHPETQEELRNNFHKFIDLLDPAYLFFARMLVENGLELHFPEYYQELKNQSNEVM